jgi:hypothetical protein
MEGDRHLLISPSSLLFAGEDGRGRLLLDSNDQMEGGLNVVANAVQLQNLTEQYVTFKVKTNAPGYSVLPMSGLIMAGQAAEIQSMHIHLLRLLHLLMRPQ